MKDSWFKKDCCYNWFFSTHGASLHRAAGQTHDDDAATNLYSRHVKIHSKFQTNMTDSTITLVFPHHLHQKSDNLQYNTLVCWDKWLIDQASDVPSIIFLIISHRLRALKKIHWNHFCKKKYLEHQTLGQQVICPSEPAYYIVDCRIFGVHYVHMTNTAFPLTQMIVTPNLPASRTNPRN